VRCAMCGDQALRPEQVVLVVWRGTDERASYRFDCPGCGETWCLAANADAVSALRRVRAPEQVMTIPAEAEEAHVGLPLTADDLLDLLLELRAMPEAPEPEYVRSVAAARRVSGVPAQRRPSAAESRGPRWLRRLARVLG
jgi:hypothetical protein